MFPLYDILEEIALPGSKDRFGKTLYADFFLPKVKLICEMHGIQHTKYIPYFHKTPFDFIESKKRDQRKRDWCELNSITLVELYDTESTDEWRERSCSREAE